MNNIAFHLEDLDGGGNWIPELADYNDPENLLIAKETVDQLQSSLGELELSVLVGDLTIDEYCKIIGISRRSCYKRLSRSRGVLEELLGTDSA